MSRNAKTNLMFNGLVQRPTVRGRQRGDRKKTSGDAIREKVFKNYALKSMNAVRAKLKQAILYIERNPKLVRSLASFPFIVNSL